MHAFNCLAKFCTHRRSLLSVSALLAICCPPAPINGLAKNAGNEGN
jgi:hypothetical protein